jgi:hypothetical protein
MSSGAGGGTGKGQIARGERPLFFKRSSQWCGRKTPGPLPYSLPSRTLSMQDQDLKEKGNATRPKDWHSPPKPKRCFSDRLRWRGYNPGPDGIYARKEFPNLKLI